MRCPQMRSARDQSRTAMGTAPESVSTTEITTSSQSLTRTGSITATGFSYRRPCETRTCENADVLAANRAHTKRWADAQVEGGGTGALALPPSISSRVANRPRKQFDSRSDNRASLSQRVPNDAEARATGAPSRGCRGGDWPFTGDPSTPGERRPSIFLPLIGRAPSPLSSQPRPRLYSPLRAVCE